MIYLILVICGVLGIVWAYASFVYVSHERRYRKTAPYVRSYGSHVRVLRTKFPHALSNGKRILDIGCGDGNMLRFWIREMGCSTGVGYEIRAIPRRIGAVLNRIAGVQDTVSVIGADYRTMSIEELQQADIVYLYLFPAFIQELEPWLHEHCRVGTVIVTNTFHFVHWKAESVLCDEHGKEVMQVYRKE